MSIIADLILLVAERRCFAVHKQLQQKASYVVKKLAL